MLLEVRRTVGHPHDIEDSGGAVYVPLFGLLPRPPPEWAGDRVGYIGAVVVIKIGDDGIFNVGSIHHETFP